MPEVTVEQVPCPMCEAMQPADVSHRLQCVACEKYGFVCCVACSVTMAGDRVLCHGCKVDLAMAEQERAARNDR